MMLEQEIEKYLSGQTLCNCDSVSYRNIKNLILGFAEPREKRIAELEKENTSLKDGIALKDEEIGCIETDFDTFKSRAKKIIRKLYSHVFQGMDFMELNDYNTQKAEVEQFLKENA